MRDVPDCLGRESRREPARTAGRPPYPAGRPGVYARTGASGLAWLPDRPDAPAPRGQQDRGSWWLPHRAEPGEPDVLVGELPADARVGAAGRGGRVDGAVHRGVPPRGAHDHRRGRHRRMGPAASGVPRGRLPVRPPHRNDAAECRPLATEDDWRQAVELRLACTEEPSGAREFCERRIADERRLAEAGPGACFGAFQDGRLAAQLGLFSDGGETARYQNVETHPAARRQGLAGTLVYHAGCYGLGALGASTLVMVADPGYSAIRIYRSVGFADLETQLSLLREPAGP